MTMMSRWRFRRSFIHLPMISPFPSLELPGAHAEYTSAVSMELRPASRKRSRMAKEVALSAVQPSTLPPSTSGAIFKSVRPRRRVCMNFSVIFSQDSVISCRPGEAEAHDFLWELEAA